MVSEVFVVVDLFAGFNSINTFYSVSSYTSKKIDLTSFLMAVLLYQGVMTLNEKKNELF